MSSTDTLTLSEGDFLEVFIHSVHSNFHLQIFRVPTSEGGFEQAELTTSSTTLTASLDVPHNEEGCRYDIVHRPSATDWTVLGGSSTDHQTKAMYTRSFVIFRHDLELAGNHPLWDVETILDSNSTSDTSGQDSTTSWEDDSYKNGIAGMYLQPASTSTTSDFIHTNTNRSALLAQAGRLDDWTDHFVHLPPPGNGPPEMFILDSDDEATDPGPRQGIKISILDALEKPLYQVIDLRESIQLDTLDDWHLGEHKIFISQCIPRKEPVRFRLPFSVQKAECLFDDWKPGTFQTSFAEIPDMHHIGAAFIEAASPFSLEEMTSIDIFVDGSVATQLEEGPTAGFAIVVVGNLQHDDTSGYCLIGFTCGTVSTDPSETSWMGAEFPSSVEAERCGVCTGLLWALQNPHDPGIPICLHFDCTSAGYAADGSWRTSPNSLSSLLTRALGQCVQEVLGENIHFSHVPAHAGIPGNEIADTIAKAAARRQLPSFVNQVDLRRIVQTVQQHGPYLWLGIGSLLQCRDLPPSIGDGLIQQPADLLTSEGIDSISLSREESGEVAEQWNLFNVCTLNVRSLFDDSEMRSNRRRFVEKGTYLAEQFSWSNYSIIGLQETCTKHQGVSKIGEYLRFCGGCDERGQLGCELWIATNINGSTIGAADCVKLVNDPRRLIIRLQTHSLDLCLYVLHAPHTGWSTEGILEWWKETTRICTLFQDGDPLFFIDSNAQLPFAIEPHCGANGSGHMSINSEQLVQLCQHLHLWIPSTFESVHPGPGGTWRHPSGTWHRIDYILTPLCWKDAIVWSWVDNGIDLNQSATDHLAVGCQISILMQKRQVKHATVDLRALQDPEIRRAVERQLRSSEAIPWETNVHTHAQLVRDQIQSALQHASPAADTDLVAPTSQNNHGDYEDRKGNTSKSSARWNSFYLRRGLCGRSTAGDMVIRLGVRTDPISIGFSNAIPTELGSVFCYANSRHN